MSQQNRVDRPSRYRQMYLVPAADYKKFIAQNGSVFNNPAQLNQVQVQSGGRVSVALHGTQIPSNTTTKHLSKPTSSTSSGGVGEGGGLTVPTRSIGSNPQERENYRKLSRVINGLPPDEHNIGIDRHSAYSGVLPAQNGSILSNGNTPNNFSPRGSPFPLLTPASARRHPTTDTGTSPIVVSGTNIGSQTEKNGDGVFKPPAPPQTKEKGSQMTVSTKDQNVGSSLAQAEQSSQTFSPEVKQLAENLGLYSETDSASQTNGDSQIVTPSMPSPSPNLVQDMIIDRQQKDRKIAAVALAERVVADARALGANIALAKKVDSVIRKPLQNRHRSAPYSKQPRKFVDRSEATGALAEMLKLEKESKNPRKPFHLPTHDTKRKRVTDHAPSKKRSLRANKRKATKFKQWEQGGAAARGLAYAPAEKQARTKYPESRENKRSAVEEREWAKQARAVGRSTAYTPLTKRRNRPLIDENWSFQ